MVFSLSSLWWRRIGGLWKLPDVRDSLRGKLGFVLMGGAMLSKLLIQFSVDGWSCVPSLLLTQGQTMVEVMKIMATFFKGPMHVLLHSVPQPSSRPPRTHTSAGDSWTVTGKSGQSLVGSLLLYPGSWCTQGSVCALQESIFQSCVSSGSSMVRLMATSSKRAYAIPRSAAPRAPVPAAVHCWPGPPQETLTHSSVSVSLGSVGPCVDKVGLSPLSISGGNGIWF